MSSVNNRAGGCYFSCFITYLPLIKLASCFLTYRVRCSSVVRAFAHGAMCRRVHTFVVDPLSYCKTGIFRSSQCFTTGVTKAVVCVILYVG